MKKHFLLAAAALVVCHAAMAMETLERDMFARMRECAVEQAHVMLEAAPQSEREFTALCLGTIIELGMAATPDPVAAAEFYVAAADMGSGEAYCALANFYLNGIRSPSGSIPKDTDMAMEYYSRAAMRGNTKAMTTLGEIYDKGLHGVAADSKKSLVYYMEAAARGDKDSIDRLRPVMEQAKAFEESHPGKSAQFPTRIEDLVKIELVKEQAAHDRKLEKKFGMVYADLNQMTAQQITQLSEEQTTPQKPGRK